MKIISIITDNQIIEKILDNLGLWQQKTSRDLPHEILIPENNELIYEPFYDDWPGYEEPCFVLN